MAVRFFFSPQTSLFAIKCGFSWLKLFMDLIDWNIFKLDFQARRIKDVGPIFFLKHLKNLSRVRMSWINQKELQPSPPAARATVQIVWKGMKYSEVGSSVLL